ncbi:MAG: hydrogenase iron-sulfur subunit [Anaerolineales bacterium]|nr:hydrogenase iron-sulfur subunit [Anaerolineales bacterium]
MSNASKKLTGPEVLPGADVESDCQTIPEEMQVVVVEAEEDAEHEHDVTWEAVGAGGENGRSAATAHPLDNWLPQQTAWAHFLEKIALAVEKPVNRLVGSLQFNPFYHTGTIAFFLLLIVGLTGIYLFMFFQYGYDLSYNAVSRIEGQFIGRTIRAIHRYASGALVITTLLHAYRTLFMERFRGPRWLAWVTGVVMTIFLWVAGVTGYWLIWDQRAQAITDAFVAFLQRFSDWGPVVMLRLIRAEAVQNTWWVIGLIMAVHVVLFVVTAVFFWLHLKRLKRAKWLPDSQWTIGLGLVLLLGAVIFPLGMLPQASFLQLPGTIGIDPIFLFFLPLAGSLAGLVLWISLGVVTVLGLLLPWLSKGKKETPLPKVHILKDRCTGCTKCALDCPYGAIQMVERHDDKPHKFIAIEDPSLCVSCGICVGSCDGVAVTLGNDSPEVLWSTVAAQLTLAQAKAPEGQVKVIFTCERHAAHGARPFLASNGRHTTDTAVEVITLPCVGTAPPDLLVRTLNAGATAVQVVGCPPDDCSNREGNLWTEQRLTRQRVPRLKRAYANAPITAAWLPPNDFQRAIELKPVLTVNETTGAEEPDYLASRRMFLPFTWRNIATAFALLAVVMVIQIFMTDLPFRPQPKQPVVLQIALPEPQLPLGPVTAVSAPPAMQMQLLVDGDVLLTRPLAVNDWTITPPGPIFLEQTIAPGEHHVKLQYATDPASLKLVLFDETAVLKPGQILRLEFEAPATPGCLRDCP